MSGWFMAGAHAALVLVGFAAVIAGVLLAAWLCLIAGLIARDVYDRIIRAHKPPHA